MMRTKITLGILVSVTLKVGDREEMEQEKVEMPPEVFLYIFIHCILRQFETSMFLSFRFGFWCHFFLA